MITMTEAKIDREKIIRFSPGELADYLTSLEHRSELESFLQYVVTDDTLIAVLSYWAKWFTVGQRELFEAELDKAWKPRMINARWPIALNERFSSEALKYIVGYLIGFQLSYGCSIGCPFCELDAVKGDPEHLLLEQIERFFSDCGHLFNISKPVLYWASETSDHPEYFKIHERII